jgi:hypothetical protein
MLNIRLRALLAILLSLAIHAGLLALWQGMPPSRPDVSTAQTPMQVSIVVVSAQNKRTGKKPHRLKPDRAVAAAVLPPDKPPTPPASMPASPPPSAEDWDRASTYTLKNSKHYRNNWGQLVRSMMGTAVAGPDQGLVRFRIEIAPDGRIANVEELWATSKRASELAWQAIRSLPPLPPTPTGKPLVFEQTIAFEPFQTGWPPNYTFDYMPDPPAFHNPFAVDAAARVPEDSGGNGPPPDSAATQAHAEQEATDQIDVEFADMNRQLDVWGRSQLNGVK